MAKRLYEPEQTEEVERDTVLEGGDTMFNPDIYEANMDELERETGEDTPQRDAIFTLDGRGKLIEMEVKDDVGYD